jgi:TonB family protein
MIHIRLFLVFIVVGNLISCAPKIQISGASGFMESNVALKNNLQVKALTVKFVDSDITNFQKTIINNGHIKELVLLDPPQYAIDFVMSELAGLRLDKLTISNFSQRAINLMVDIPIQEFVLMCEKPVEYMLFSGKNLSGVGKLLISGERISIIHVDGHLSSLKELECNTPSLTAFPMFFPQNIEHIRLNTADMNLNRTFCNLTDLLYLEIKTKWPMHKAHCWDELVYNGATIILNGKTIPLPHADSIIRVVSDVLVDYDSEEPVFPGGDNAMYEFISENLVYPFDAREKGEQGKVYVRFVIGKEGYKSKVSIARGVSPELDAEALRIVNLMPPWTPGKQNGVPVNTNIVIPIVFKL